MKAVTWHGKGDVRVETVPDPSILNPQDVVIAVSSTAICGSDLHLYNGFIPAMKSGDILGHEFMGRVVEVGSGVKHIARDDRVVVPFNIACGHCIHCGSQEYALCDDSNPNAQMAEALYGYSPAGLFGYSHLLGGYAGGQAQYVRVPFADTGCLKVPEELSDEQVLFLSDIFPTGYMAAENAGIRPGDSVAIWGCGPVGQFAIRSAFMLGAEQVIALDRVPERLALARAAGAVAIDESKGHVLEQIKELTGGRGPDGCIDAVGLEAHGHTLDAIYDRVKQALRLETGRAHALREAIQACRKGGTISVTGVYGGLIDKMPMGAAFGKGLTFRMGQTHVHRYMRPLLARIQNREIDPSFIVSHRMELADAPEAYSTFRDKADGCTKVVLSP